MNKPNSLLFLVEICAVWESRYNSGMLCVSLNFIFFVEASFKGNFWLPLSSVQDIQLLPEFMFPAIVIYSKGNDTVSSLHFSH